MVEIVVRNAQPADRPTLQRIFRSASLSNPDDRAVLLAHPDVLQLDDDLIGRGRTRVATLSDGTIIGFASSSAGECGAIELDDLFVDPDWRRRGAALQLVHHIAREAVTEQVGRVLVVIELVADESGSSVVVATAAADIGNLRFYQRQGFRVRSIERDAFTTTTGYPAEIVIDGIALRDRIWMDYPLAQ